MKITLVIEQSFDIDAGTLLRAYTLLREGYFPTSEILLEVRDKLGHDITERWRKLAQEMD